jgi:hypothetical protein
MEAAPRLELGIKVLQTSALPLGYAAINLANFKLLIVINEKQLKLNAHN